MAVRTILTYPDPKLTRVSEPVERFDSKLSDLVSDMVETMRLAPGIGLAAPQVGVPIRLIVVEVPPEREGKEVEGEKPILYTVCNPVITQRSGEAKMEEGCLSVPGLYVEVDRSAEVTIEGKLPSGAPFSLDANGLLAICFQHEIDHLQGKLLVNYVSSVKRELYKQEVKKRKAETVDARKAL